MKRLVIIAGIVAGVCCVVYQFRFANSRSRLKVEASKMEALAPPAILAEPVGLNETVREESKPLAQIGSTERKLMKVAAMDFQVNDATATKNSISALVKQFNAYVASHKEEDYRGGPQYETIVRVPSDKLDDFMTSLDPLAKKMRSKNLSSQDVTDEYIDISERLVTQRELERNYREILRKARKVSEMLEVEQQLAIVRGEIESIEARIEYINKHVSYSTLTITYYQLIIQEDDDSFGQKIAASLGTGWSGLLAFVVAILAAWPLLIVGPIVVWASVRMARKWQLLAPEPVSKG